MKFLTVSDLNDYIKGYLEKDNFLSNVFLEGEVSNLKMQSSGHWYFSLKDEGARISACMFARANSNVDFALKDGMKVLVTGRISSYPVSGSYQIYVDTMKLDGVGQLYVEFEKLKNKLNSEGLFNKENKKKISKYPSTIGVVAAPLSAALKDIISTVNRRFPGTEIIVFPSLVQGVNAPSELISALRDADNYGVDTIIIGRGGGSYEDLWCFNDEELARTIFNCKTPVISAVGHEIDTTISDYVADLRAPTPTGAAELAVASILDTANVLSQYKIRLNKNIKNTVNSKFILLRGLKNNFILNNPLTMYEVKMQKLDSLSENVTNLLNNMLMYKKDNFESVKNSYILKNPCKMLDKQKNDLGLLMANLKNLNPLSILEKGYSVAKLGDTVLKKIDDVSIGDSISIKLKDGNILADITGKENLKNDGKNF